MFSPFFLLAKQTYLTTLPRLKFKPWEFIRSMGLIVLSFSEISLNSSFAVSNPSMYSNYGVVPKVRWNVIKNNIKIIKNQDKYISKDDSTWKDRKSVV